MGVCINYQKYVEELFKGACLASCYSYLGRKKFDWIQITEDILNGVKKGYLDSDCYVSKPIPYLKSVGINVRDIRKVPISKLSDLPEGLWIVEFKKTPDSKDSHFVVATKKKVIFDPSGNSITVNVGNPVSYREFIY